MSRSSKTSLHHGYSLLEVKSKLDAEFRRFSVDKSKQRKFEDLYTKVEKLHRLKNDPFVITYSDKDGDLLPINNDDNYNLALQTAKHLLRIMVQRKEECAFEVNGYGTLQKKKSAISKMLSSETPPKPRIKISMPEDFRRVSAIIDVDIVPETHRRVKLMKNGSDKPLGFYIRDGTSVRVTPQGLEKVPAIFISRLVPGGLAESTGLLAVNDEVLEVNGIDVAGKTLDQVTDMMVANSSNLIITVKPVNQRLTLAPNQRGGVGRHSQMSNISQSSAHSSQKSYDSDIINEHEEDDDEVQDLLPKSDDKSEKDKDSAVVTL
ncbi:partitioning defective 6 homolog beta-like [Mytilus trossulus]|uniref:partitioning defective 6 homolog beta-like n=1 Tax=Mytilus trossulus TaxID=6551 RepID=UPI0030075B57